jgi:hypothetical protein
VNAHYYIGRGGETFRLIADSYDACHAKERSATTIGVELFQRLVWEKIGKDWVWTGRIDLRDSDPSGKPVFTPEQKRSLGGLLCHLKKTYPTITRESIVFHSTTTSGKRDGKGDPRGLTEDDVTMHIDAQCPSAAVIWYVSGKRFESDTANITFAGDTVILRGLDSHGPVARFRIPARVGTDTLGAGSAFPDAFIIIGTGADFYYVDAARGSATVTITARSAGCIAGTFEGSARSEGGSTARVFGTFRVETGRAAPPVAPRPCAP